MVKEKSSSDLPELSSLGEKNDWVILKKMESPRGVELSRRGTSMVNGKPKRKTRSKIQLAEKINVGGRIIKICLKRENRGCKKKAKKFWATKSIVIKIKKVEDNKFYILTQNSKYEARFVK